MPTDEHGLSAAIAKAILSRYPGSWVFHPVGNPYQRVGVPDLLVCVQGRFFGLEVKHRKPGESYAHALARATVSQRNQITKIRQAGGVAGVVTSPAEALELVKTALA